MQYTCEACGMAVKGLQCVKCDCDLVDSSIEVDGATIRVSKCPNDDGMIKSPQCCGQDMRAD